MTAQPPLQPHWCPFNPLTPTKGPYPGPNDGRVVIRAVGSNAVIDCGELLRRSTFTVTIRSIATGQPALYQLLRVRVEPAAT